MDKQSFTRESTAGGTLLIILANISSADLIKTAVLAALGATVSFGVSLLLKWMIKKAKNR